MPGLHSFIEARNQRDGEEKPSKNGAVTSVTARRQAIANLSRMPVPKMNLGGNGQPPVSQIRAGEKAAPEMEKTSAGLDEHGDHHWDGFSTDLEDYTETSRSEEQVHGAYLEEEKMQYRATNHATEEDIDRTLDARNVADLGNAQDENAHSSDSGSSGYGGGVFREEDPTVTLDMDHQRALWSANRRDSPQLPGKLVERPKSDTTAAHDDRLGGGSQEIDDLATKESTGNPTADRREKHYRYPSVDSKDTQQEAYNRNSVYEIRHPRNSSGSRLPAARDQPFRRHDTGLFDAYETYNSSQSGEDIVQAAGNSTAKGRFNSDYDSYSPQHDSTDSRKPTITPAVHEADLDFPPEALYKMTYEDLKAQPFDDDPNTKPPLLPPEHASSPLSKRLAYAATLEMSEQSEFCNTLSTAEWEEAGDWFLDQFSSMLTRMKDARREKRVVATAFEAEIEKRESVVRKDGEDLDQVLFSMRKGGQEVLHGKDT